MSKVFFAGFYMLFLSVVLETAEAKDIYLFYNINSKVLSEIDISRREVAWVFDNEFGPASDELPTEVREADYFVSMFPDKSYVFILNAPYNCGQLGCTSAVYERDADGDLMFKDFGFPLKCRQHEPDKMLCVKGGYKVEKIVPKKKGPVHYPAPRRKGDGF